jgi:DNA-binding transcriptional regulator YiaG
MPTIKEIRKKLGLTRKEFAQTFKVSLSSVIRWESRTTPPARILQTLLGRKRSKEQVISATLDDATRLHLRIRRLREGMGLSQGQFARTFNVRRETIVRWESGGQVPHEVHLEKLNRLSIKVLHEPIVSAGS